MTGTNENGKLNVGSVLGINSNTSNTNNSGKLDIASLLGIDLSSASDTNDTNTNGDGTTSGTATNSGKTFGDDFEKKVGDKAFANEYVTPENAVETYNNMDSDVNNGFNEANGYGTKYFDAHKNDVSQNYGTESTQDYAKQGVHGPFNGVDWKTTARNARIADALNNMVYYRAPLHGTHISRSGEISDYTGMEGREFRPNITTEETRARENARNLDYLRNKGQVELQNDMARNGYDVMVENQKLGSRFAELFGNIPYSFYTTLTSSAAKSLYAEPNSYHNSEKDRYYLQSLPNIATSVAMQELSKIDNYVDRILYSDAMNMPSADMQTQLMNDYLTKLDEQYRNEGIDEITRGSLWQLGMYKFTNAFDSIQSNTQRKTTGVFGDKIYGKS